MNRYTVFGSSYMAMWAWVRETDPQILRAIVDRPIPDAESVHLNGFDHLWFEVRAAARQMLDHGSVPYWQAT